MKSAGVGTPAALALAVLTIVLCLSCGGNGASPAAEQAPTSASAVSAAPALTLTPAPTQMPLPAPVAATPVPTLSNPTVTPAPAATMAPMAAQGPLSPAQVFQKVSPSIGFVQTSIRTGSGVLIEGGYVVTNAHVVWPFDAARVAFPDGAEFINVPVKNWDLMGDLAVLGPIDVSAQPMPLTDDEGLGAAAQAYLIGYPHQVETVPQPTITRGLLSRVREWDRIGMTYFRTDAGIEAGQSGGVLASDRGEIMGIASFSLSEAGLGLVVSSVHLGPRVEALIADEDPSGPGDGRMPVAGGGPGDDVVLLNWWHERAFFVNPPVGTAVKVQATGIGSAGITVYDSMGGDRTLVDHAAKAAAAVWIPIDYEEPYFVVLRHRSETPVAYRVSASHDLSQISDPDDGRQLEIGRTTIGGIDFPGDPDYYIVILKAGETVVLTARSPVIDTFLLIDYQGATDEQIIIDDNSGAGIFGLDSKIVYRAPHTGTYFVVVENLANAAPGGYVITLEAAAPGAELTSVTRESLFIESGIE